MSGISIKRTELTAAELRAAAVKTKDARAARRMLAIALVLKGVDRATVVGTCGMDRQTLRDWVHRSNAEGLAGLVNRSVPHPPRRRLPEHLAALAAERKISPKRCKRPGLQRKTSPARSAITSISWQWTRQGFMRGHSIKPRNTCQKLTHRLRGPSRTDLGGSAMRPTI